MFANRGNSNGIWSRFLSNFNGIKFLVVDDEELLCQAIADFFSSEGATVYTANSGKKAVAKLSEMPVDVVISDVRMPDGDGKYLAENIPKNLKEKLTFYFCSGYNDLTEADLNRLGVKFLFSKPFDIDEMAEMIKNDLHQK